MSSLSSSLSGVAILDNDDVVDDDIQGQGKEGSILSTLLTT